MAVARIGTMSKGLDIRLSDIRDGYTLTRAGNSVLASRGLINLAIGAPDDTAPKVRVRAVVESTNKGTDILYIVEANNRGRTKKSFYKLDDCSKRPFKAFIAQVLADKLINIPAK